jgi:hypothetical protein
MRWRRLVDMGGPPEFNPKVAPDREEAERLAEKFKVAIERLERAECHKASSDGAKSTKSSDTAIDVTSPFVRRLIASATVKSGNPRHASNR